MSSGRYEEDLAWIHHAGFGAFARRVGPALLRRMRQDGIDGGRVVDLGCGSGIWLAQLLRAGYEAVGVDPSAAMLRLARLTAPAATLVQSAAHELVWPRCDAVTAMGEALSYSAPRVNHPRR